MHLNNNSIGKDNYNLLTPQGIAWEFGATQIHLFIDGKFSFLPEFCYFVLNNQAKITTSTFLPGDDNKLNTWRGRSNFCLHFGIIVGKGALAYAWESDGDRVDPELMKKRGLPYTIKGGNREEDIRKAILNRRSDTNNEISITNISISGLFYLPGQEEKPIDKIAKQDVETILTWKVPFYWIDRGIIKYAQWENGNITPSGDPIPITDVIEKIWVPENYIEKQMKTIQHSRI